MHKKNLGFLSHLDLNLYLFRAPIMQKLIEAGHHVFAICPMGEYNEKLRAMGCHVINYEIERQGLNPLKEMKAVDAIYEAIKELKLDLLHTFTAKPNIYGTFAAKRAKVPVILNLVEGLGSFYVEESFKNTLVKTLMEHLYKRAFKISDGCVFVNSDDPKYMIEKSMISREKVHLIKSVGIDTSYFNAENVIPEKQIALKKALHVNHHIVILMVARAIWHKGVKEYYDAANALTQNYNNLKFLLVGDTDEGNISCADTTYLNSGCVTWLGHRNDIFELTALSDIYVLPSYREGVPRTLLEAASMAKPIVTTDTVGCREVVEDSVNGFLVPIKDSLALQSKIEILINNKDLRRSMGEKGRIKALKEFDIHIVLKHYVTLYQKFLSLEGIDV
jgi:N,N'-diacetylbacillosaminyl-diphospho-undecaprenol alpha-1,3-N-acetylgalactosaminyltransferase